MATTVSKVVPFLWFPKDAEEAVRFYVSVIPNSSIDGVWELPTDGASGPSGPVKVVEFKLGGVQFNAMEAGRQDPFNHAVSFVINCDDQSEIDRLWAALVEGGKEEACGWLKDRYGVSWQIVPTELYGMMTDKDKVKAKRVADAMLQMVKFDIATFRAAYAGKAA